MSMVVIKKLKTTLQKSLALARFEPWSLDSQSHALPTALWGSLWLLSKFGGWVATREPNAF